MNLKKLQQLKARKGHWQVKMFNQTTGAIKEIDEPSARNLCKENAELLVDASMNTTHGTVLVAEKMPRPKWQ